MKFDIEAHYRLNPQGDPVHDRPDCFCKRFKNGEEMWTTKKTESPPATVVVTIKDPPAVRDPSQSEQPWHVPQIDTGRSMERMFPEDGIE